jgi:hypothetical protein
VQAPRSENDEVATLLAGDDVMEFPAPTQELTPSQPSRCVSSVDAQALACLETLAARYVWWKTPEEAMLYPDRVAAQVMNLGTFDDLTEMVEATGEDYLREVLQRSEAGQLNARSWHYWHYRLGLAEYGVRPVPPMPVRKLA